MFEGGSNFENDLYQNIPSMALQFAMYTPTFGNGGFVIQPASAGTVQDGFQTIPYLPLEAMIYQQQNSSPQTAPTSIVGGSNTGQQVIQSSQTANDVTGTSRVLNGSQQLN